MALRSRPAPWDSSGVTPVVANQLVSYKRVLLLPVHLAAGVDRWQIFAKIPPSSLWHPLNTRTYIRAGE